MEVNDELMASYVDGTATLEERKLVRAYLSKHPEQYEHLLALMDKDKLMPKEEEISDCLCEMMPPPIFGQNREAGDESMANEVAMRYCIPNMDKEDNDEERFDEIVIPNMDSNHCDFCMEEVDEDYQSEGGEESNENLQKEEDEEGLKDEISCRCCICNDMDFEINFDESRLVNPRKPKETFMNRLKNLWDDVENSEEDVAK